MTISALRMKIVEKYSYIPFHNGDYEILNWDNEHVSIGGLTYYQFLNPNVGVSYNKPDNWEMKGIKYWTLEKNKKDG